MVLPDLGGVTVGQYFSIGVRNHEIDDVRLLSRFPQQSLNLKSSPAHPHHTGPGTRLEGPYQGCSFFQQQLGCAFLLVVYVFNGHEDKKWEQHQGRTQDDPGRHPNPPICFCLNLSHHP